MALAVLSFVTGSVFQLVTQLGSPYIAPWVAVPILLALPLAIIIATRAAKSSGLGTDAIADALMLGATGLLLARILPDGPIARHRLSARPVLSVHHHHRAHRLATRSPPFHLLLDIPARERRAGIVSATQKLRTHIPINATHKTRQTMDAMLRRRRNMVEPIFAKTSDTDEAASLERFTIVALAFVLSDRYHNVHDLVTFSFCGTK